MVIDIINMKKLEFHVNSASYLLVMPGGHV